jgi:6,7-dimethyl-8-ribityllumazine synthase
MGRLFEGSQDAAGRRFAIAAARFNESITSSLVDGARRTLEAAGGDVDVAWCPGGVELPLVALKLARSARYDAIVAIGCVIRGGTPHFDYVAQIAADGIREASAQTGVPIAFGVLTCDTMEQALDRAGPVTDDMISGRAAAEAAKLDEPGDAGVNKGIEAAEAVIEMVSLLAALESADR